MSDNYGPPEGQPIPPPGVPPSPRPVFSAPPSLPAPPITPTPYQAPPAPPVTPTPYQAPPSPPVTPTPYQAPPSPPVTPTPYQAPPSPPTQGSQGAFFGTDAAPAPPKHTGPEKQSNLVFWIVGAVALVLALIAFFALRGDDSGTSGTQTADRNDAQPLPDQEAEVNEDDEADSGGSSFFLDPVRPDSVATDASSVWVSDAACGVVVRIDKATEEVTGAVNIGGPASGVAVAAGSVWVGGRDLGSVFRIDVGRMTVAESVPVPGYALGLTAEGNDIWVTDGLFGSVHRVDAGGSRVAESAQVGGDPHHVAIGARTVWVTNTADDTVSMIPRGGGGAAQTVAVGGSPLHVEIGAGSAWVTDSSDSAVRRLDENTGETQAVIDVGIWPHALAFANGYVWVGTENGSFWKIDPSSNSAERVEDVDFTSIDTAVDGSDIWIADANGGTVVRFDAASGTVGSTIDLREFGDCQTFQDEAFNPPSPDISL